jgi:hypothetical protein
MRGEGEEEEERFSRGQPQEDFFIRKAGRQE